MNTKATSKKIAKVTSKGQITLPAAWREHIDASHVIIETKGDVLEIRPANIESNEYTVFDAIRDNKGKGIKAIDLVSIIDDIDK
jgi:AbrB family looped-hinge helix DNA binding protein